MFTQAGGGLFASMSAFERIVDLSQTSCGVRKVPIGDMEFASINERGRQLRRPYFFEVGLSVEFWASRIAKRRSELGVKDRDR